MSTHRIERAGQLEEYAEAIRNLGRKCDSTECIAVDALNYLYNRLNDGIDNPCALIRFFRTMDIADLTPGLKDLALQNIHGEAETKSVNCLTLLASRGMLPQWNDRFESKNHQVIPLTSAKMVAAAPMVSQLIGRLGIEVAKVVTPRPNLFFNPEEKAYHVFYVPYAIGDSTIVAQKEFAKPYGIQSVIGFGGLLPSGDMFATIMFMRIFVSAYTAERFKLLAKAIELAIHDIRSGKKQRAKILLAVSALESERLKRSLGEKHQIAQVDTIEKAISAVRNQTFDLVICGVHFDESRMFELLRIFKENQSQRPKPFICFQYGSLPFGEGAGKAVIQAAELIGASCYLDGRGFSDMQLRRTFESYLPEKIWTTTTN